MSDTEGTTYDLLIIGAGINGAGIARDAAGRGLSVLLCDGGDIGGATSWASSKLIHGGLRYLEHYNFGLVAESLAEREVLLRIAPHLTRPLRFVLPRSAATRPGWMLWCGLWLYDLLASLRGPRSLPGFETLHLSGDPRGAAFLPEITRGFAYSDVAVDDARLTLANARAAAQAGAVVLPQTRCTGARRAEGRWIVTLEAVGSGAQGNTQAGAKREVAARALVNAAGPWAGEVSARLPGAVSALRLVRGSHIVVPRLYPGEHACTLQGDDGRVVFVIPFQQAWSLVGTTEVEVPAPEGNHAVSPAEVDYLCRAVGRYLRQAPTPADVAWSFSGVRPLIDDGKASASAVSREYRMTVDAGTGGDLPLLTLVGGKLTTYRRLAEAALARLQPWFPRMGSAWTAGAALSGGDLGDVEGVGSVDSVAWGEWLARLRADHPQLPADWLTSLAQRHGSDTRVVLDGAQTLADLGRDHGGGLYQREVDYCVRHEWARTADDVLWRRTKCGLRMTPAQRAAFQDAFAGQFAEACRGTQ